MTALATSASQLAPGAPAEELTAPQWVKLLGTARGGRMSTQAFRKRCTSGVRRVVSIEGEMRTMQVFAFADLPADYRQALTTLRDKHVAATFAELLDMRRVDTHGWAPARKHSEYPPGLQLRAEQKHAACATYYAALNNAFSPRQAARKAAEEYRRVTVGAVRGRRVYADGIGVSTRQVDRWIKEIDARGGEAAPLEAYHDEKSCPHVSARLSMPEEFVAALKSKALEPGVRKLSAAFRAFEIAWMEGKSVPGVGRAETQGAPFPLTIRQLRKYQPSKAARESAGVGRFVAKASGLLPAMPLSSAELRLRERIVFDDKRLDMIALEDATGRPVSVVLYIAMDEATRQILGYLLREDGAVRQTDVEGLTAFILRTAGFAGQTAGYATTLKFERGTVAISPAREQMLKRLFPAELVISRTKMVTGGTGYSEGASGNFFGKAKLESFMKTLDEFSRHLVGQRGNHYRNTPLMLGDLLATPEKISSPQYKLKGSMIEEAVMAAQTARALAWTATGQLPDAAQASAQTGVRGPLLYVSELTTAVQGVIAYYNAQRDHRREGFADMPMIQPDGRLIQVRESSNDKAARLQRDLAAQGRGLQRISEADTLVLLHKVKRVTVRPNGARVRINGTERIYWSGESLAVAEAQQSNLGEREYLALYNPEDPRELYLLKNPVGRVPLTATELPADETPHFFEALPLYHAPEMHDEAALAERARAIASNHSRVQLEIVRNTTSHLAAITERRARNTELAEPLRAALSVLRDAAPKADRPETALGREMREGRPGGEPTRAEQQREAESAYAKSLPMEEQTDF